MRRYDVIADIVKIVPDDVPIVCNIGDPCKELHAIRDRQANFYMLGSLGLASSIGLGIALCRPRSGKVIVIDGDGGTLMNMGSLATLGRYAPDSLIVVLVDNGAHGSTGDQPTATSVRCNLAGVARACGVGNVRSVASQKAFIESLQAALTLRDGSLIHVKVTTERPATPLVNLSGIEVKERFMKAI